MFDFDAGKFLIIGVVALVVIGPKELPRVLRQVGQMVGRVRRMATEFQGQFMDAMKEADIESIRQELKTLGDDAELNIAFDPARDIQRELTTSFEAASAGDNLAVEGPAAATAGFALPAPAAAGETGENAAAEGIGPVVDGAREAADPEAPANGTAALSAGKKRKIIMTKRRVAVVNRVHAVSDRTEAVRARAAPPRLTEAAHR